jgi:hypothetical protein
MRLVDKPLQVWHFPQVPCEAFKVDVKDEYEALKMANTLADQHIWLEANNIIPDYSNAIMVLMYEDNEWIDYYNEHESADWDEMEEILKLPIINKIN